MNKRVFIVHGWGDHPRGGWFPWIKKELEAKGFSVFVPSLPDTEHPRIYNWVPALATAVGVPDENTYFIGHSMGCQTIARYLEGLQEGVRVGGAVFVAGFFRPITNLENEPDVLETGRHWLNAPIDFERIRVKMKKSVAIFSDNDEYVSLDNQEDFRDKLGSEIVIESAKGHLNGEAGVTELPSARDSLLKVVS